MPILKSREGSTGKDLQYAATSFNLGQLYQETKRLKEAEVAFLVTAGIEEPIFGSSNESFTQTLQQIASLYALIGDAEKLQAIRQKIATADPFNTVTSHLPRGTFAAAIIEPSKLSAAPGLELLPF
jgi:hypothetical protein